MLYTQHLLTQHSSVKNIVTLVDNGSPNSQDNFKRYILLLHLGKCRLKEVKSNVPRVTELVSRMCRQADSTRKAATILAALSSPQFLQAWGEGTEASRKLFLLA
jgi:hypothetical protein